jgi:hypothetical protein
MRTTNVVRSGRATRHTRQAAACTTDATRGASNLATRPRAGICTSDTRAGTSGR